MAYQWAIILLLAFICCGCAAPNAELIAMNERAYMIESRLDREAAGLTRIKQDVTEINRQMDLMRGSEIASRLAELESGITAEEGAKDSAPRIKVLGRQGLDAAREAASRLTERGMSISAIELAPADDGTTATAIYFNKGREQEARDAAAALGGSIELRPMKWPSIFELIIIVSNRT